MNYLEELLNLTKENEGENSSAYLQVNSKEWQINATAENTYLLLSMERDFNVYMKRGLSRTYSALGTKYNLDPTHFQKIEFGKTEHGDETISVLVKNIDNNKLYAVMLKDYKIGDNRSDRDFKVVSMQEIG